jgi:hypothetical protein
MTWTVSFFALVFCVSLVAGIGWALGNLIVARLAARSN